MNLEPKPVMPLNAAYVFGPVHGLKSETKAIKDMEIEWDSSYTSTVRRGYFVELFTKHKLLETFKKEHWPFGKTEKGEKHCKRYLQIKSGY